MKKEELTNKRALLNPAKTWEEFQADMEAATLEDKAVNICKTVALWTLQAILVVFVSLTLFTFAVVNMLKFVENWRTFGIITPVDYVSIALGIVLFAVSWYITNRMFDWLWGSSDVRNQNGTRQVFPTAWMCTKHPECFAHVL